ncbi:MAG: hypothetical protein ACYC6N_13575 [Pirellulaceae bacterium]
MTITEICERKRAEEKLRATLGEKEVLLREIDHGCNGFRCWPNNSTPP